MGKISGPLLDRIDIHIELPSIKYKELTDTKEAESSAVIKARVERACVIRRERFKTIIFFITPRWTQNSLKNIVS